MDLVFNRTTKIPKKSYGGDCSLCPSKQGVPIECSAKGCKATYHTTCAIKGKLKMQAIFGKHYKGGIKLRSYCRMHTHLAVTTDLDINNSRDGKIDSVNVNGLHEIDMTNFADDKFQDESDELDYFWKYVDLKEVMKNLVKSKKTAKSVSIALDSNEPTASIPSSTNCKVKKHKKIDDTNEVIDDATPKQKKISSCEEISPLTVDLIYRYWILLRTVNNGQSLIKFSPSALKERESEQKKSLMKLRIEMERIRNLSYMIGKREKLKASWLKTHHNILKHTMNIINEINPVNDNATSLPSANGITHKSKDGKQLVNSHPKKVTSNFNCSHMPNGMFDESDQLINDLVYCDQIHNQTVANSNLSYQESSTLERRRTLSLVRRINRQLKGFNCELSMNPYAKNYLAAKRSDSPQAASTNNRSKSVFINK